MLGYARPENYVFPACENGSIDPTRPQKSWRSAWRSLTRAAGLKGLRFHDLRHHAITELAEPLASDQTIMSIAGHVSREMLEHYSHVRLEAKRRALDALSNRHPVVPTGPRYDTNHVTNAIPADTPSPLTERKEWSGRLDLNQRPPGPEPKEVKNLSAHLASLRSRKATLFLASIVRSCREVLLDSSR